MAVVAKVETALAGMGEIKLVRGIGVLGCIGLGSCVGTVLYDPMTTTGAVAHVMLPQPHGDDHLKTPGKYATTAIPALLRLMEVGAQSPSRLRAILIGGAEVFQNREATLQIGARNVQTLKQLLAELRIPIVFEDTGGHKGRTFELDIATGILSVRCVGQPVQTHDLNALLQIRPKVA